jgi:outer membrane protein OmpA-like peptidoglycan-associated protein
VTETKRMLFGGAAVSLALATMAASGLPVRAQLATDVAACAELEGEALAACLEAELEPEAAEEPEPELLDEAEAVEDEAVDEPEAADAAEPEAAVDEPELPAETEAQATDEAPQAVEEAEPELREETEAETTVDEALDEPEASDTVEPEAGVDAPELPAETEAETLEAQPEAVEEAEPEIQDTEVEAVEDEAVDVPGASDAAEPEAVEETEAIDDVEAVEEPEVIQEDAAVEEDEAVDASPTEESGAEALDPADVLSEAELEAAQRESIAEAVQTALAAERQKSQGQQETERDDRMRILGAAAAGLAAGAILPQIGAMLVGQQGDRVILQQDDRLLVRRDETARFLQEGSNVTVEDFADGLSLVTVTQLDGSRVLSWRDASGQVVRRVRALPDGREITLFDGLETAAEPEIRVTELPPIRREDQRRAFLSGASAEQLLSVLSAQPVSAVEDRFTLRQILANDQIRWLMPSLALDAVTFDTGSATLGVEEIRALDTMGRTLRQMVEDDPQEVFLVEGHTDAVGSDILNLALSDRRAETVAMLLTSYYQVPPENLLVQGFGEQDLRVPTLAANRDNRRVEIRRITPLLR